jgi:hypothetical protein
MYSLDCEYFDKEFSSITLLLEYVMISGMDPNYGVTKNGKQTGEMLIDYLMF